MYTVYDQSDAVATINFSPNMVWLLFENRVYRYTARAAYISFSACVGVATIYSEILAHFSPGCGSFSTCNAATVREWRLIDHIRYMHM